MDCKIEVPKDLINEFTNPSRKRPVRTILRENWSLVENIDAQLKKADDDLPEKLSPLVTHIMKNFMKIVSFIANPRKLSARLRKPKDDQPEELLDFENDLRDAQRNWGEFFRKYENEINMFTGAAKQYGKVDFHEELWQQTRLQKLTSAIANFSESVQNKTVSYIPPSRYLFAFVGFLASWTIVPVFNTPKKITSKIFTPTHVEKPMNGNGVHKMEKHGTNHPTKNPIPSKIIVTPHENDEAITKFHESMKNSENVISEKEQDLQNKLNVYQKEISARLEVQEKRLHAEIDAFEHEKEQRRKQEEEEFSKKMMEQDQEFQKIIRKIDVDRKIFAEEKHLKLMEACEKQDEVLLKLLNSSLKSFHWEEHEEYWASRLNVLRNSLSLIRSEFWSFERYFRQQAENPEMCPNFVRTIFEMESASFGQTVTRAQTLISNQHEFFDVLFDKYDDDLFLKVLWKATSQVANQLDKIIFELWSIAVNSHGYDYFKLRSAVMEVDPSSIPTTWRLKGICHSADPSDYEDSLSIGSPSVYSHF